MRLVILLAAVLALTGCNKADNSFSHGDAVKTGSVEAVRPPAGSNWTDVVVKSPDGGFIMGNPAAPIKLVEYGSRTCPICGMFGRSGMRPLEDNYVKSGKVSYEFREYLVHGPPDLPASLLGRCVGTKTFFPVLEAMYQGQAPFEEKLQDQAATAALQQKLANAKGPEIANAWADYMGFVDFMKQRGLPEAKARACLNDQAAIDQLTKMMDTGNNPPWSVTGTPNFYINGQKVDANTWAELEPSLKSAGA